MQLVGDKESIKASKAMASPARRKPLPPKKTVVEEAADSILAELKEVFIKDVRSRIVNPIILECLDPSQYRDVTTKRELPTAKVKGPDATIPRVKEEIVGDTTLGLFSITNRIQHLPRIRKKGESVKADSVTERKPTKADVLPMHHQFNHYSDSENEDEKPNREATAVSDDEDESSRPSRETTSIATPEPLKIRSRMLMKPVDFVKEEDNLGSEMIKDLLDTASEEVTPATVQRKRIIDFTDSENEMEGTPTKKPCVEPEVQDVDDAMQIDETVTPTLSKPATIKRAKAKGGEARRRKKVEVKPKEIEDAISVETIPVQEVKVEAPKPKQKIKVPEVSIDEFEDDDDLLLDLDGVQSLVRDREDYGALADALSAHAAEPIYDIWTWAWKQKKLKALNFSGAEGTST